jgi:ATP-dependent DNA helicase DinG
MYKQIWQKMTFTIDSKNKIRDFYRGVSTGFSGFMARSGQRQMIACVSETISKSLAEGEDRSGENICVIEGRTGVGKTVGYLVPSLTMALEMNKKLIISSATVALQEQLMDRDLPAILELFEDKDKIKVVLAKGRARYACNTKLRQITNTSKGDDLFGDAVWERPPRPDETEVLFKMAKRLGDSWSGDRDDLGFYVADDLWQRITNDNNGCSGKSCGSYDDCSFMKSRAKMRSANVIVANHDFLLTSLKAESKAIPDASECIFIFDEAHHLPEIAVRRFSASHSLRGSISWVEKLASINDKIVLTTKNQGNADLLNENLKKLSKLLNELQSGIDESQLFQKNNIYRYPHGQLDPFMDEFANNINKIAINSYVNVEAIVENLEFIRKQGSESNQVINKIQSDLGFFVGRLENLCQTWELFSKRSTGSPLAKWIELKDEDYVVSASPLSASETLSDILWSKASCVVLTSATITTLGTFDFFLQNTGLNDYPETTTLAVKSPFDFQEQGQIFLPRLKSNPKDYVTHTAEIVQMLPELLSQYKGTLVLFSSKKQMNDVFASLVESGDSKNIIVQSQYQKKEVLKRHIDAIQSGESSAIFGLSSFGEGVDLPGDLCTQVIITKIPFSPPDTPTELAIQEWVEARGGDSFNEISLPKAGLKLTQWVGRLIRSETDRGRIVFLDSRMSSARYSKRLMQSLPEFSVLRGWIDNNTVEICQ